MTNPQILVVEDEAIVAENIRTSLNSLRYAVAAVVSSGEEAIAKAGETGPDLVLMDIRLKGPVDGIDAAKEIRERFDIPVVYLTAYTGEATLQRAKVTEPYGYIVKPFQERELHTVIEIALYKHKMERKLRESERWLATTLRSIGDGVIATDEKGLVVFMNPVVEALTGWRQEDALGRHLTEVFNIIDEETRAVTKSPVMRAIREGVVGLTSDTLLVAKDGGEIPIGDIAAPIRDGKGRIAGVVLTFQDITERKRAEEALRRAHDELERRVEERTAELTKANESLRHEIAERKRIEEALRQAYEETLITQEAVFSLTEDLKNEIAERKRAEKALRRAHDELEVRVEERTAELRQANEVLLAEIIERKRVETALRESEEKYRTLFDRVPVGLYRTAPDGQILDANLAAVQMLRFPDRESLLAVNATDLYVDPEARKQWQALMEGEGVERDFEMQVRQRDGTVIWVRDTARVIRDGEGRVLYYEGSIEDVTERKRAEEAQQRYAARLKQQAEELASLNQASRVLTSSLDVREVLTSIVSLAGQVLNSAYTSVLLVNEDNTLDISAEDFQGIPPIEVRARPKGITRRIIATSKPQVFDEVVDDGTHNPSLVASGVKSYAGSPLIARGRSVGVLFTHSTEPQAFSGQLPLLTTFANQAAIAIVNAQLFERVRAGRERLQTLSHRLVEVQETERQRIARELHDEVGQLLTGLKLTLEISVRLPADAVRARLGEAQALIGELMTRVRDLSLDLRPAMLDDLGLLPALLWHFERYAAQTNVEVTFEHTGLEGRFAPEVETAAYRIVQEALTNVARHAGVSEVTVRLWASQDTLGVQIEDQGAGFDPEAALASGATSGLAGMRERPVLLGGQLTVESAPGAGTRVTAELPLRDWLERRSYDRFYSVGR